MSRLTLLPAIILAACALPGQAAVDLNGLAAAAGRFATRGMQGSQFPLNLDLRLIRGEGDPKGQVLMGTAQDVQSWVLFYNAANTLNATTTPSDVLPAGPRSASVKCTKGVFHDFLTAPAPIPDCKSLDGTWFAVSLDAAVTQLNALGYVRGFSRVEARRPNRPDTPPDLVYVFTCPWERTNVAISATTGALAWYQTF
jgi:hypothetical protein